MASAVLQSKVHHMNSVLVQQRPSWTAFRMAIEKIIDLRVAEQKARHRSMAIAERVALGKEV